MQPIKVNTERVDKTVHHVALSHEQLEALVLDAVAKAAGVTIDRRIVRVRQCYLSSRMGSIGTEFSATCTIEVDHQAEPVESAASPPCRPAAPQG